MCTEACSEMDWKMSENCGVFGCVAADPWPAEFDVSKIIYMGLLSLQHRGQESCGIVTNSGTSDNVSVHKGSGQVNSVFNEEILNKLKGNLGVGHTRYSTAGKRDISHCQPFMVHTKQGLVAVAHNGELANAHKLRDKIWNHGVGLSTLSDSEIVAQLISLNPPCGETDGPNWFGRFKQLMESSLTAYSLVVLQKDRLFGVRDPYGNRPLCIGKLKGLESDDALGWVISSESCAFQSIGAEFVREVLPGEVVSMESTGITSLGIVERPDTHADAAFCIFEYVYFSRPDSMLEGQSVYTVRERCGRFLAMEAFVEADVVSTVPESATPAAFGFAKQSNIPYAEVLCKNRYAGRSFIQPNPQMRQQSVAIKFGPLIDNIKGKRVVLVDDSIVRGNTIGPIVRLLKNAGATEVHIRVASPPIKHPCYMGINIPTEKELIANRFTPDELALHIGADSLKYLSVEGLKMAVANKSAEEVKSKCNHCTACLTGHYPISVECDW